MAQIEIDGQSPDGVLAVRDASARRSELGDAEVVVIDSTANRDLASPGADLVIDRDGDTTLSGYVSGEPSQSNGRLTIRGLVSAGELAHLTADRVAYDERSSAVAQSLVTTEVDPLERILVHTADDASQWTSEAPVAHRYQGGNAGLYRWGTDLVFIGGRQGDAQTLRATFTGVTSDHIRDGFYQLETRLAAENRDDLFSLEIELVTPDDTTYLWEPDLRNGFWTYELAAEQASTEGEVDRTGVLQYRFKPQGTLVQNAGAFIDHAATIPFRLVDRDTDITIGTVDQTERRVTRRITERVGIAIDDLAMEDGAVWEIDTNDAFNYRLDAERETLEIVAGETPVTGVSVDRDYEDIRNRVTVEYGEDGAVTVEDPESIAFYGPVSREEPLSTDLEREEEAIDRGEGYLSETAWNDALATFHVADMAFARLRAGQRIHVDWPPESLFGDYTVDERAAEREAPGVVSITIAATSD